MKENKRNSKENKRNLKEYERNAKENKKYLQESKRNLKENRVPRLTGRRRGIRKASNFIGNVIKKYLF